MKKLSALFVAMTLVVGAANLALASDPPKPSDHKEKKDEKKPAEKKDEKKKH